MDKREFLSALEKSLSVLQEDELRDIVSEYEQHIDIKVAKGLTEEEAIADFGSFSQLTAELLEAYHVRADYAASGGAEDKAAAADGAWGAEERKHAVWAAAKGARLWIAGSVRWITCQVVRPFSWFWKTCRTYVENLRDRRTPGTEGEWGIKRRRLEETDTDGSVDGSTAGIDRPGRKGRGGGRRGFLSGGRVEESTQGQVQRRKKRIDMIIHRIG